MEPTVSADAKLARAAYRPRRKRSGKLSPLQITPRDIDILRAVARYRFLNSEHICRLVGGSPKNLRSRLKELFEHAYLDRPECQYDFYRPGGGSSLAVYALADKGARLLIDEDGYARGLQVSRGAKNHKVGRPFLEHTLGVADFAIGLRAELRDRRDVELLDGDDLLARMPPETQAAAKPLRFSVPVIFRGARHIICVEPDYAFSLGFPKQKIRANYLVEIDRGTMPIERSDLSTSSILRKFLGYQELWRSKRHTSQFGWRNFRVLILTTDAERSNNMRACLARLTGGERSPLFWFADKQTVDRHAVLHHHWWDGSDEFQTLAPVDEPTSSPSSCR